jgi:hypothetical protein
MRFKMRVKAEYSTDGCAWEHFRQDSRHMFLGTSDPTSIFRSSERQRIIHYMLMSKAVDGGVELDDPLLRPAVVQHFPLHMQARQERLAESWLKVDLPLSSSQTSHTQDMGDRNVYVRIFMSV